jgi:CubicO group peptidase (beta-lactamase class C family)
VVKDWPEFGAAGKGEIPVRWLLSHQAGLPVIDTPLTFEDACAWHPVIRALEAQKPLWQPIHPRRPRSKTCNLNDPFNALTRPASQLHRWGGTTR